MPGAEERVELKLKLPDELQCWQCIIQWTYVAGNNWGEGPQMADFVTAACLNSPIGGLLGCGPQETFRGCADVCIGPRCPKEAEVCSIARPFDGNSSLPTSTTTPPPPTSPTVTTVTPPPVVSPIPFYE